MIDQRRPTPVRRRARRPGVLWNPRPEDLHPRPDDVYLVIDEEDDKMLVVLAARWPELDALGRLHFEKSDPTVLYVEEASLERAIRRTRRGRRPLRIGDVFLLRGLAARTHAEREERLRRNDPSEWGQFIDVTGAAREAAKIALLAAAAPRVSDEAARALGLDKKSKPDPQPRRGTTAVSRV